MLEWFNGPSQRIGISVSLQQAAPCQTGGPVRLDSRPDGPARQHDGRPLRFFNGCGFAALGPGLLESAYEECLFYELKNIGLFTEKQKPLPLIYEEVKLDIGCRVDLFVEKEVKSVEALNDIHLAQILTNLKLSNCRLGMLINFNVTLQKNGLKEW